MIGYPDPGTLTRLWNRERLTYSVDTTSNIAVVS
jgi:hypothetical protein